jgi:hypothetical protein
MRLLGFAAVVSLALAAVAGSAHAQAPVTAYISPGHLFPVEGTLFQERGENLTPSRYRPLPAHAGPGGARIGEVRLERPECVGPEQPPTCAGSVPQWRLHTEQGSHVLEVAEYSYETLALVTRYPVVRRGARTWARIDSAGGAVWVAVPAASVFLHERLAHVVGDFDSWCRSPGQCAEVPPTIRAEVARVAAGAFELESCYPEAYEIQAVVATSGRRYYRVTRAPVRANSPAPALPREGYVPVRKRDGSHTGSFYPRGC